DAAIPEGAPMLSQLAPSVVEVAAVKLRLRALVRNSKVCAGGGVAPAIAVKTRPAGANSVCGVPPVGAISAMSTTYSGEPWERESEMRSRADLPPAVALAVGFKLTVRGDGEPGVALPWVAERLKT